MITRRLEREARRITERDEEDDDMVRALLVRELALVLSHLVTRRSVDKRLEHSLRTDEARVHRDLTRLERLVPEYSRDEARLRARLLALEAERRRLAIQQEERLRGLYDQLLAVLHKYRLTV